MLNNKIKVLDKNNLFKIIYSYLKLFIQKGNFTPP